MADEEFPHGSPTEKVRIGRHRLLTGDAGIDGPWNQTLHELERWSNRHIHSSADLGENHPLGPFNAFYSVGSYIYRFDFHGDWQLISDRSASSAADGFVMDRQFLYVNGLEVGKFEHDGTAVTAPGVGAGQEIDVDRFGNIYLPDNRSTGSFQGAHKYEPDGTPIYQFLGGTAVYMVADYLGNAFVAYNGKVSKLDPVGNVLWENTSALGYSWRLAVTAEGDVVTVSQDGILRLIDGNTGETQWEVDPSGLMGIAALAVDLDTNIYYQGLEDEIVTVRKANRLGEEIWRAEVPALSYGLAVDPVGSVYYAYKEVVKKFTTDGIELWSVDDLGISLGDDGRLAVYPGLVGPGFWGTVPPSAPVEEHSGSGDAHTAQFALKQSISEKGVANGYAPLDADNLVPVEYIPGGGGSGGAQAYRGTAQIADPDTSSEVVHGLTATPNRGEVQVTPSNDLGAASKFWLDGLTSLKFDINIDVAPGAGLTADFDWLYLPADIPVSVGGPAPPYSIALVVVDTGHASTTNVKAALEAQGHTVTSLLDSSDRDYSLYDLIVCPRSLSTQAKVDWIVAAWELGTPVIWGLTDGITAGVNRILSWTMADLSGEGEVIASTDGVVSHNITSTSHPITSSLSIGTQTIYTAGNFWTAVEEAPTVVIGDTLAQGGVGSGIANNPVLVAIDTGTERLNAAGPTPTRTVLWGGLYAGQSAYTVAAQEILHKMCRWVMENI